jgi:hypothetical protein
MTFKEITGKVGRNEVLTRIDANMESVVLQVTVRV